ncbi:hypothetical protein [Tenacibaculum sp. nBUS_03]|uniref:hypothetical protein n=1 Tax=Tenacibaculum sp. nBUS_03 TaxID=3395320 RepID=UPI003EBB2A4A
MKNYVFSSHWYIGFIGFVGFYYIPFIIAFFQGKSSVWVLTNLLSFLWFSYFIPENKNN